MLGLTRTCAILGLFLTIGTAHSQSAKNNDPWEALNKLHWQFSGSGRIGEQASIQIPTDHAFLGATDTRRFLELNGNLPVDNEYTIARKDLRWFAVFEFDDSGYVRDDETLDADSLLNELKRTNRLDQEERKRHGLEALTLEGWFVQPHYDLVTKRLEWGTKLRTESNDIVVNYNTKLLGRRGVMNVVLVSNPQSLDQDTREFKSALAGYSFSEGERYSELRSGDKMAEYGLSALIIGGAAAAAAKSGAFKGLAKLIGVGVLGILGVVGAGFKKLFRRA
jgi:uncharacterized membrane-anchored protein